MVDISLNFKFSSHVELLLCERGLGITIYQKRI